MNVKIFERFRAACDEFFKRKAAFFKSVKESMAENLEKKKALCEKAEALKDSTDWKETAEILTKLQKEWKNIGPVAKKHSDAVWKRFIGACDYFFAQKNKATSSQRSVEFENMAKKEEIIKQLAAHYHVRGVAAAGIPGPGHHRGRRGRGDHRHSVFPDPAAYQPH